MQPERTKGIVDQRRERPGGHTLPSEPLPQPIAGRPGEQRPAHHPEEVDLPGQLPVDLFQSTEGRDAYLLHKAELPATSGVPGDSVTGQFNSRLANLANSVRPTMPDEPDYAARLDDYGLLYAAVSRIKEVFEYAHYAPSLNSGSDAGPPNPANIRDLAPDGSLAIAGESLDYQLAVLTVATEFNTTSLSLTGGLDGALGNRAMGQGVGDGLASKLEGQLTPVA